MCVIFSGCPYTILHQKDATDMAFIFLPVSTCNTDVSHQNHAALYSFFVKTAAVGFTLSGLCLPLQEEEVQYNNQNLLSSKISVSRMHSLPNDSYMFRPVRPASAPYPLDEVDLSPQHQHSGKLDVKY